MESFKKKLPMLIAVILVLILVLLLVENWTGYRLNKKDGEYYIDLGNKIVPVAALPPFKEIEDIANYGIRFQSVAEMVYDISVGNFTEDELAALSFFSYRDGEEAGLKAPDISNLYEPCLPSKYKSYGINWSIYSSNYSFYVLNKKQTTSLVNIIFIPEASYSFNVDELVNFESLSEERNRVILEKTYDEERNATAFVYRRGTNTREYKDIIYQIEKEDTILTVKEYYLDESLEKIKYIKIYGSCDGQYFEIMVYGIKDPPSLEWVSQFGLKKFEP